MKKLLSVVVLSLVSIASAQAHSLSFEMRGKCGEKILALETDEYSYGSATAMQVTRGEADKTQKDPSKADKKVVIEPSTDGAYVMSVTHGSQKLGITKDKSPQGVRSWGWSYLINGADTGVPAGQYEIPYWQNTKLEWVYGYILVREPNEAACAKAEAEGTSKTACMDVCIKADGTEDLSCTFTPASANECQAKTAE